MDSTSVLNHVVFPIRIPTPFAVGDVYSYLIKDDKIVLVDCGHKSEEALGLIASALREQDLGYSDIDEIWLTHGHPDHFGQAAILAEKSGARLIGHAKERANFAGNNDGDFFEEFFDEHQIPPGDIKLMIDQLAWLQQYQEPIRPDWIEEGENLTTGSLRFKVKHTPGHAPGHLTFYSESGVIFGGDILLEHISTNALINFDPDTGKRNKSLLQYRNSLRWIRDLKGRVFPGHGKFIPNINEIVAHHLEEHQKRYQNIQKLLGDQPYSLYEVALKTFPDAMKKGAAFLVLSEVLGYLDWGLEEGVIEEIKDGEKIRFFASS